MQLQHCNMPTSRPRREVGGSAGARAPALIRAHNPFGRLCGAPILLFLPISRDRALYFLSILPVLSSNHHTPQMQAFPALSSPLPVYASADRYLLLSILLARSVVSSFLSLLFNNMKSYDQVTSAWSALFFSSYWHSLTRNSHCFARIHWHSVLC